MGDTTPSVPPSRRVRLAWYAAVAAVALALPLVGYRFDLISLDAPLLYDEDALLILPMVKATIDRGSHWRTEQLGAPGVQEMHDFPVIDHLHFAAIWLLGRVVPDAVVVFNLYYLLTYPLAALAAMAVLRHFALSFPAAAVGGVLYAMLPYHFYRGQCHYFLSAYFFVPVTATVILWVMQGRLPGFPVVNGERKLKLWHRDAGIAVLICGVTAAAGAYYAFFAAALMFCAGLYGWVALRTWKAAASAFALVGVIFVGGVLNHAPTFAYQAKYGKHTAPTERYSEEAELYGLKLTQLLLPIDDHRLKVFAEMKASYNSLDRPVQAYTERYSLGLIGACGVVLLLARVVLPVRRVSPYAELAAVTAFAFVVATVGGFGAIFNHVVSPQVRCYNRIAVYVAFFALYAVLFALDHLFKRWHARIGDRRHDPPLGRHCGRRRPRPDAVPLGRAGDGEDDHGPAGPVPHGPHLLSGGGRDAPGGRGRADGVPVALRAVAGVAADADAGCLRPRPRVRPHGHPAVELRVHEGPGGGRVVPVGLDPAGRAAARAGRRGRVRRAVPGQAGVRPGEGGRSSSSRSAGCWAT